MVIAISSASVRAKDKEGYRDDAGNVDSKVVQEKGGDERVARDEGFEKSVGKLLGRHVVGAGEDRC